MTAISRFEFGHGYRLEPAGEEHRALAENWTAWDSYHAGKIEPGFWLSQGPCWDSYLLSDGKRPVFFFKIHREAESKAARFYIQYMPCATRGDRERVMEAMTVGCAWLEEKLRAAGVEEVSFTTQGENLLTFAQKRLGFTLDGEQPYQKEGQGELVLRKRLSHPEAG